MEKVLKESKIQAQWCNKENGFKFTFLKRLPNGLLCICDSILKAIMFVLLTISLRVMSLLLLTLVVVVPVVTF